MRMLRNAGQKVLLALDIPKRLQRLLELNHRLPNFANEPDDIKIEPPFKIYNPGAIFFGNHVRLGPGCVLSPLTRYPGTWLSNRADESRQQLFNPTLRIGNGVVASGLLQIFVQREVDIGDNVMFASNVLINDASHGYLSAEIPYRDQPLFKVHPVRIEEGCWIGQNVVILPGVTIGAQSIVGANSVVTHDVSKRSIVAGAPARVIKRWDPDMDRWVSRTTASNKENT